MSDNHSVEELKLAVRLSPSLLARIDEAARVRGLGRSAFVRQALSNEAESVLGTVPQPSLFDVLSNDGLVGRFSGPAELSTTPRAALRDRIRRRDRTNVASETSIQAHQTRAS